MRYILTTLKCLSLCALLGACDVLAGFSDMTGDRFFLSPRPWHQAIPQGDDDYSRGFRAGCSTFTGVIGSGALRAYGFEYDPEEGIENKEYYKGYRIGSSYCTQYLDPDPI